jgi:hypothetical protein
MNLLTTPERQGDKGERVYQEDDKVANDFSKHVALLFCFVLFCFVLL